MIDKNNLNINDLEIGDFEELATHIIRGQSYNMDFYKCEGLAYYNWYDTNPLIKLTEFNINIAYSNLIEEDYFIRSFGILLPYLKTSETYTWLLTIPFIKSTMSSQLKQISRNLIHELTCQAFPLNSDPHPFKVTTNKILNYEYLTSSNKPNSYTYSFEYIS